MRFEVGWQPEGPNAAPEERATVADLRIFIGDRNACENQSPRRGGWGASRASRQSLREADCATVSVYPLAEEIALNWWRLFGARDAGLRLTDGRGGYALPNIRLALDGAGFNASCSRISYDNPAVRFTNCHTERLSRADAESVLTDFIGRVCNRLASAKLTDTGLQLRWCRVQRSRDSEEESAFCEAAGALGFDPYSVGERAASAIEDLGAWFCGEPLLELVSGLRRRDVGGWSSGENVLAWLRRAEARSSDRSLLPAVEELRIGADAGQIRFDEMPWSPGYRGARAARRQLDIGAGERFQVSTLARRLGGPSFEVAGAVTGVRAVVATHADATHVHLRTISSRYRHIGELFALGRAVGDAVANPPAERSAVNDLRDAARQATGRAFAAEFLAPIDEILSMQEDGMAVGDIAADLGVFKEVVTRQLENRERIQAACAASTA